MISIAIDQEWNSEKFNQNRKRLHCNEDQHIFNLKKRQQKQWIPREYEKIVAVSSYQGHELTKYKSARTKSAPDKKFSIVFGWGSWSESVIMHTVLEITVIVFST